MTDLPAAAEIESRQDAAPVPSLRERAVTASLWTVGGYIASQVLRLAGNVVLASLLAPGDFGLMALVLVFLHALQLFSDTGIHPSIIHSARGDDADFLNTAWTIQAGRGVILWVLSIAIAAPVAAIYRDERLVWLLPVAGLSNVFAGLSSTSLITLNRRLVLGRLTVINLGVRAVHIAVMVVWALLWPSVWALVGGTLLSVALRALASHTLLHDGIRNRVRFDRDSARMLYRFGKWVFVGTIIGFLAGELDRLLLGRLASMEMLGVYSIAAVLAMLPQRAFEELASRVLFPVLAVSARQSRATLGAAVRRARAAILPAAVIATAGIALLSPAFFEILYDERYREAGWIAQLVCLPVWFVVLADTASKALYAVGDSRSVTLSSLIRLVVGGAGCLLGLLWFGLPGFIVGFGLGAAVGHVVMQVLLARAGVNIIGQDVVYSLVTAGLVGSGLLAARLAEAVLNPAAPTLVPSSTAALLVIGAASLWAWRRVRAAWLRPPEPESQ